MPRSSSPETCYPCAPPPASSPGAPEGATLPYPPLLLAGLLVAVSLGGLTQGALGFGFGLVSLALMTLIIGVKAAVPVVALLALVTNLSLVLRLRDAFVFRDASPLLLGAFVGAPIGVLLLRRASSGALMTALGLVVLAYVLQTLRSREERPPLGRSAGAALGLLAGLLGGAFGTSGPPSVVWVSSQTWPTRQLRASLVVLFVGTGSIQLTLLGVSGELAAPTWSTALATLPTALFGSWAGARLGDKIPAPLFRKAMLSALGVVSLVFVFSGLRGL